MARRNDYPFHKLRKGDFGVIYPLFMLSAILCVIVGFVAFLPFALPFIYIFKNDRISELWQVKERHKILFVYLCSLLTILTPIACMLFYIYSKEEVPFIYVLWVALFLGPFFKLVPNIFKGDNSDGLSSITKVWKNAFCANTLLNLCPYILFIINPKVGITTRLNDDPWVLLFYLLFFTALDLTTTIKFRNKIERRGAYVDFLGKRIN